MATARTVAYDVLERVFFEGAYSHIALSTALEDVDLEDRDRGLATELVYGVLARKRTLDTVLEQFVDRPLEDVDRPVLLSLRLAAYQLMFLDRIPEHAAVDESVELTKSQAGGGAAGFTNGVLRSMLRDQDRWAVWERVDEADHPVRHLGLRHSLPDWIAQMLLDELGEDEAYRRAEAFNGRPPLYLRALDGRPDEMPAGLEPVEAVPGAWRADSMSDPVLEAVRDDRIVVQDLASQLVGHFAGPGGADSILDTCAGLGGKTLHLAALAGDDASVLAVEPKRSKLDKLEATAAATSLAGRIETFHGKIQELPDDYGDFDLVVVDAPCSGLGVIRRHPETRWRRTPEDVADRASLQARLLDEAAGRVAQGGILVYSVCTFTGREGPRLVESFLDDHPDFERAGLPTDDRLDWSQYTDDRGDLSTNPADHDSDAFYAARLRRV